MKSDARRRLSSPDTREPLDSNDYANAIPQLAVSTIEGVLAEEDPEDEDPRISPAGEGDVASYRPGLGSQYGYRETSKNLPN